MTQALRLESFLRRAAPPPPPAPTFDAHDVAAARAAGHATGLAAGLAEGRADAAHMLATAINGLAAALEARCARNADATREIEAHAGEIVRAVITVLAPPLRAEALAARTLAALRDEIADGAPPPPRLRCEAAAAPMLRAALDAGGLGGIALETGGTGAEFAVPGGVIRLDPARIEAALHAIVAEIGADRSDALSPETADHPEETGDE